MSDLCEFDKRVDLRIRRRPTSAISSLKPLKDGKGQDVWNVKQIREISHLIWRESSEEYMAVAESMTQEMQDDINRKINTYVESVKKFRGEINNDLNSIKASASQIEANVAKMNGAYKRTIDMLNSPEMAEALKNAERLASALAQIAQVRPNKIAFAVLENKPAD